MALNPPNGNEKKADRDLIDVTGLERLKYLRWTTVIITLVGLVAGIATSLISIRKFEAPQPQPSGNQQPQLEQTP
jgi:hypothetical protein